MHSGIAPDFRLGFVMYVFKPLCLRFDLRMIYNMPMLGRPFSCVYVHFSRGFVLKPLSLGGEEY